MRYLKKYKQLLERKDIPSDFIVLNSIGHVLDPDSGDIYAIFKGGKEYDSENPYEFDSESAESLYDEEMKEVEKYKTTGEEIFKKRADENLIDDVEDILLDITDVMNGQPSYGTWVECGTINVYYHRGNDKGFNDFLFPAHIRMAEKGDVIYTFRIYNIAKFTYRVSNEKIGSLNQYVCTTDEDKCKQVVDTTVDTLVRLVLYLRSTGYYFEIDGVGKSTDITSGDVRSRLDDSIIPYEEALRKLFKQNLEFGAFNSNIVVTVTHP